MKPAAPKLTEADLERYGTELLQLDGWRPLKTDPVSRREWGKGFGELGMADYLYIRYALPCRGEDCSGETCGTVDQVEAEVLWCEWKSPRGKPKPHQIVWIERERALGALVLIAGVDFPASPEGFMKWYRESGLMRRRIT